MHLKLQPYDKNLWPVSGFFIKGDGIANWLFWLQNLELHLKEVQVYPLPGTSAKSIWGCYVETPGAKPAKDMGPCQFAQCIDGVLVIPEKTKVFPAFAEAEIQSLFKNGKALIHHEIGCFELGSPLRWEEHIEVSVQGALEVAIPEDEVFIPSRLKRILVQAADPDEALEQLEKEFPGKEPMPDKPLNGFEKARLALYTGAALVGGIVGSLIGGIARLLSRAFSAPAEGTGSARPEKGGASGATPNTGWFQRIFGRTPGWLKGIVNDFNNLQERNQKEVDKLMSMLKKNPLDALKYALPIDSGGTGRGSTEGGFFLFGKFLSSLSLFDGLGFGGGSGGGIQLDDGSVQSLRAQYYETAEKLIRMGEYYKAAYVYLRLLQDYTRAAEVLKQGGLFAEAASVYLKYLKDDGSAAHCYEEGAMYQQAIELYVKLNSFEKAGDLYIKIGKTKEAMELYEKVYANYLENDQYVKAAVLARQKMSDQLRSQNLLLRGWDEDKDAKSCLGLYFTNTTDLDLPGQVAVVYANHVAHTNNRAFMSVVIEQYKQRTGNHDYIKDIAYEIAADQAANHPEVISELKAFNSNNTGFMKDAFRFRQGLRSKKRRRSASK